MKQQFYQALAKALAGRHGAVFGTLLGAVIAIAILCFGFWRTFFVVCVALVGLYIGRQVDAGRDVFGEASDSVLRFLDRVQNMRHRRDLW